MPTQTKVDETAITCGGQPRSLNEGNPLLL